MDFVKNEVEGKMNKDAQPGNSFEAAADQGANQGMLQTTCQVIQLGIEY